MLILNSSSSSPSYILQIYDARELAPHIRMGCGYEHYKWLETHLSRVFESQTDGKDGEALGIYSFSLMILLSFLLSLFLLSHILPVTFYGSNDFHHVSLSLIRRINQPVNVVLFDVHPDYLLNPFGHHCGSWFNIVNELETVKQCKSPFTNVYFFVFTIYLIFEQNTSIQAEILFVH